MNNTALGRQMRPKEIGASEQKKKRDKLIEKLISNIQLISPETRDLENNLITKVT